MRLTPVQMSLKQRPCGWLACLITANIAGCVTSQADGNVTTTPAQIPLVNLSRSIRLGNGSQGPHPDGQTLSDAAVWLERHGRTRRQIVAGRTTVNIVVAFDASNLPTASQQAAFVDAAVSEQSQHCVAESRTPAACVCVRVCVCVCVCVCVPECERCARAPHHQHH
jgi:hypothetical protein